MPPAYKLPGRADGVDGLLALAEHLGPASTFNLIRTCRTAQGRNADRAGDTMIVLARRVIASETLKAGGDADAGFKNAAAKLGYPDFRTRGNLTRLLKREPASKGDPELLRLARDHGPVAVYDLILLARTARPDIDQNAGRDALVILARRLVDAEMESASVDELTARQRVADKLGYTAARDGNSRSNFTAILKGGRPPETRPRSEYR